MRYLSSLLLFAVVFMTSSALASDITFNHVWSANDVSYPTGLGWADFDNNGWPDLFVANGLDVQGRANTIYFNGPDSLSSSAGYFSTDLDPSCQVSIGDLDSDGDPEVVVSSLGYTPLGCPPYVQLIYYHNNGTLDGTASWSCYQSNGFSNALGDYDGDGDLDIVFALGDLYSHHPQRSLIFENIDGVIATEPSWSQNVATVATDAAFVDIDLDGDLDLAITGDGMSQTIAGAAVYYNNGGIIESIPSWVSVGIDGGPQLDFGDVDNDGYPELAIANGGLTANPLCVFKNNNGVLESSPSWTVPSYNASCCVAWGDLDGDGDLDLIAGSWYDPTSIFINNNGSLSDTAVYEIITSGYTQMVSLADFDQDYLIDTFKTIICNGSLKLFSLKEKPIHKISSILLNGLPLDIDQYCYELEKGWVSLDFTPDLNDTLRINYTFSLDLDVTISSGGVFLFENKTRELNFFYPHGLPLVINRGLQTEIEVVIGSNGTGVPKPGTGKLHYSINDEPYTTVDMDVLGENHYRAVIPPVSSCEDNLKYYFSALEIYGRRFYSSDSASPNIPPVITNSNISFEDNFLLNKFWDVTGNATSGGWERGQPVGDGSNGAPTMDFDGSGYCYLTGNTPGDSDVDNGITKLISPTFAISENEATFINYAFWFNNNCGANPDDYLRVYLTNDVGANWVLVDEIIGTGEEASGGWYVHSLYTKDFITSSEYMQLMFEVADLTLPSCVEAAIDDVKVIAYYCQPGCCIGDVGNVDCSEQEVPDISDITRLIDYLYISHTPLCCPSEADANISGGEPDISDITRLIDFLYLTHYPLPPCP